MKRRKAFQRIIFFALILGAAAFAYLRPLSVLFVARDMYLRAIGMRGAEVYVGGHRIHYRAGGEGPPLVVVHGIASRADDGALIYRELMRTHRVYALDLLGYGDSDRPLDGDFSIATEAEIIRGFMDAVGLRQADVMGVSMGGWAVLKMAAEHPERVRRLVLVASGGLPFETTLTEASFSPTTMDELRFCLALQTDRASSIPTFVLRDFLWRSKEKAWVVRRSMGSMLTGRDMLDGKLQRVTMPVLLVWGTNDRIVPFPVSARMKKELPQAELVTLEGCGHLAIIECRDRAVPAIERFLWSAAARVAAFERAARALTFRTRHAFESGGLAAALHIYVNPDGNRGEDSSSANTAQRSPPRFSTYWRTRSLPRL
ncbi:MAG TPA: alpha/beta hydrolase [Thermoanaerobaculia bacterium]|jgi:pimeloyl-ACP methyl ester carboxylesterase|nr:alpha/beta hydrolase [Thermoanaerobaculia bacterium]